MAIHRHARAHKLTRRRHRRFALYFPCPIIALPHHRLALQPTEGEVDVERGGDERLFGDLLGQVEG